MNLEMENNESKRKEAVVAFYIIGITSVLTLLSDGLAKYFFFTGDGFYRFSLIIRGTLQLAFIGHLLFFINKHRLVLIMTILVLFLFFLVGQYILSFSFPSVGWVTNFIFFNRFIFPLIIGGVLFSMRGHSIIIQRLWRIIRWVLFVNSIIIIIGFALNIQFLKTYPDSQWKFGFDGLIFAQNEASYFYIIGLLISYYDAVFLKKGRLFFGFILLSSVLIGTKAVYIFLLLVAIFHFFYFFSWSKSFVVFLGAVICTQICITDDLLEKLTSIWSVFLRYYENEGLVTALLSGRDNFIALKFEPLLLSFWRWPNFFIGGHDFTNFYMEMGFFDLFLMFGWLGSILYLSAYFYFVFPYFRIDAFLFFSALIMFVIVFTAGHFFESPVTALYVTFFSLYMRKVYTERIKER